MFLYIINHAAYEKALCDLEMKYLFGFIPTEKHFFSEIFVDASRSPFIKLSLDLVYVGDSLEGMLEYIKNKALSYEDFKVKYFCVNDKIEFKERLNIEHRIGDAIVGEAEIHEPKIILGFTKINDKWYFGEYKKNEPLWDLHAKGPYQYSNAITNRIARATVNLAVGNDLSLKVLDPCCGIGTIVMEAVSMGIDIIGYDINYNIIRRGRTNFKFFEYEDCLFVKDMHKLEGQFDVVILDIPYGILSITNNEIQEKLIAKCRELAKRLVLITIDERDECLEKLNYKIIDKCLAEKKNFKRFITICELK